MPEKPVIAALLTAALFAALPHALAADAPAPDLGALCLKLAVVQEPEVDVAAMKKALDALVAACKARLGDVKEPAKVVAVLNAVLLKDRQVTYISNKYWRDSTLSASLLRGRGNCLSTTTLYVVIAQRLSLPIHAVVVPHHAFARYDDGKTRINIETTRQGATQTDEDYQERHPWYPRDEKFFGYNRSLSADAFAAVLHQYGGRHLLSTRRPQDALVQIQKAKALWPENLQIELDRLSVLRTGLGEQAKALEGYKTILATSKSLEGKTFALLGLAGILQDQSRHEQALSLLRQAYRITPRHLEQAILSSMASSYRTLRRFDEALVAQELSTVLGGEAEDFTGLAIFYKNANKLEDAIRCLRVAVKKNPESWNTRLILAGYLIRAGHDEEGWKMFATVKAPRVNMQFFHTNMTWFHGSVGKKKEFLEHLEKALALSKTPGILNYVKTEVDFDRYRDDKDFKALIEKHRQRLGGR